MSIGKYITLIIPGSSVFFFGWAYLIVVWGISENVGNNFGGIVLGAIALCVMGLISLISSLCSISEHTTDLANLRGFSGRISTQEDYLEIVRTECSKVQENITTLSPDIMKVDEGLLAKAGASHPITSLIKELSEISDTILRSEINLLDLRKRRLTTLESIEARKIGLYSWVVALYGES